MKNILNFSGLVDLTRTLATSSAINPALLLSVVISIPFGIFSFFSEGIDKWIYLLIAIVAPAIASWQIIKFSKEDPKLLQNDKHIENMKFLETKTGVLGAENNEIPLNSDGSLINNPLIEEGHDNA